MTRLGIFGGSFDPVPRRASARRPRRAAGGFASTGSSSPRDGNPPHKPGRGLAPGDDRLAMLRLAIGGDPNFEVHGIEPRAARSVVHDRPRCASSRSSSARTARGALPGPRSDNLEGLPSWREASGAPRARPARSSCTAQGDPEPLSSRSSARSVRTAARKVRAGHLALPPVEVSSSRTCARSLPALGSRTLALAPDVLAYIRERGLYGPRA
jgi:nicotinic acid mononucleotide adenylyltransferase